LTPTSASQGSVRRATRDGLRLSFHNPGYLPSRPHVGTSALVIQVVEGQLTLRLRPQSTALSRLGWTRDAMPTSFDRCDPVSHDLQGSVLDFCFDAARGQIREPWSCPSHALFLPTGEGVATSSISALKAEGSTRARREGATLHDVTEPRGCSRRMPVVVAAALTRGEIRMRQPLQPRSRSHLACDG
jgi:hypothetical protein